MPLIYPLETLRALLVPAGDPLPMRTRIPPVPVHDEPDVVGHRPQRDNGQQETREQRVQVVQQRRDRVQQLASEVPARLLGPWRRGRERLWARRALASSHSEGNTANTTLHLTRHFRKRCAETGPCPGRDLPPHRRSQNPACPIGWARRHFRVG